MCSLCPPFNVWPAVVDTIWSPGAREGASEGSRPGGKRGPTEGGTEGTREGVKTNTRSPRDQYKSEARRKATTRAGGASRDGTSAKGGNSRCKWTPRLVRTRPGGRCREPCGRMRGPGLGGRGSRRDALGGALARVPLDGNVRKTAPFSGTDLCWGPWGDREPRISWAVQARSGLGAIPVTTSTRPARDGGTTVIRNSPGAGWLRRARHFHGGRWDYRRRSDAATTAKFPIPPSNNAGRSYLVRIWGLSVLASC